MTKVYYKNDRLLLIQGDCLEVMGSLPMMFDATITDIPYGTTRNGWDSVLPFDKMWESIHAKVKPDGAVCLFGAEPFASALRMSNAKEFKYDWYWHKSCPTAFLNAKKQPLRCIESVSVFYTKQPMYTPQMRTGFKPYVAKRYGRPTSNYNPEKGATTISNGDRYPIQLLEYPSNTGGRVHPTQKPVELIEYLIRTYTNEGDTILDFTCGSGTTLIAGLNTNRKVVGIELDEGYCEIAKQRILKWYEEHK